MNELDVNRLMLQFEKSVREINKAEINPKIPELKLADLNPVVLMVAKSRARYLQALFELAGDSAEEPGPEQIKQLQSLRQSYNELSEGAKALEIAIERGYLDIKSG